MSNQNERWKTAFILLIIAVALIGSSLYFNWRLMELQSGFNRKVAANAANSNTQIANLVDQNEDLQEQILVLEQAILDLESWIEASQENQDLKISNNANDIINLNSRIDSTNRQLSSLWNYYYELEARVRKLEHCKTNCTSPECPSGSCESCSYPYCDSCPYCGVCYDCDSRYCCP